MFRRISLIAGLLLAAPLLLTLPAWAQDEPQGEFQREGRRARGEWRGEWGGERGERAGRRGQRFDRMRGRLIEELDLDEVQQAAFEDIMAEQREQWRERRESFREIRQAEEDGDVDRAEELRTELGDRRGRGNPMEAAFAQLEEHLGEDQLEKLDQMRERFQQRGRERLDRMAERLELDDGQRGQLEEIGRNMRDRMRARWRDGGGPGGRGGRFGPPGAGDAPTANGGWRRRGFEGFFDEVEGILREDQIPLLDEMREERAQRAARGGRGGGERRGERRREQGGGMLDRLAESIDFSDGLALDDAQQATLDAAMRSARTGLMAGETNEEQALGYVLEKLQGSLNRNQIEAFGEIRQSLREQQARDLKVNDVRLIFMAIAAVDLDPEQARTFRKIYKTSAAEFKKVRKDREAQAKLAEKTKKQIVEMLSPRQLQRFERRLERVRERIVGRK